MSLKNDDLHSSRTCCANIVLLFNHWQHKIAHFRLIIWLWWSIHDLNYKLLVISYNIVKANAIKINILIKKILVDVFDIIFFTLSFSRWGMSLVRRQTRWRRMTMVLLKYVLSPPLNSPASSAPWPARTSFTALLNTVMISLKFTGGGELLELSFTDLSKLSLSRLASWICPLDRPETF